MLTDHRDKRLIRAIHLFQRHKGRRGPISAVVRIYAKQAHAFWSIVSGSDISRRAQIAKTVRFPHPTGVVVHADAVIEDGCQIQQQVTIGQRIGKAAPVLKKGCYIGAGAKVLGGITIGEGARVGANAVVIEDVPAGCSAVGIPARILTDKKGD